MMNIKEASGQELVSPSDYYIGFDISFTNATVLPYVNDVPLFATDDTFSKTSNINTTVNLNHYFVKGKNDLSFLVYFPKEDSQFGAPEFKVRYYYWLRNSQGKNLFMAPEGEYASEAYAFIDNDEKGNEVVRFSEMHGEQPYLKVSSVSVPSSANRGEWFSITFTSTNQFNLASPQWSNGQTLKDNQNTASQLKKVYQNVYSVLERDQKNEIYKIFEPNMVNAAQNYGRTTEEMFASTIGSTFVQNSKLNIEPINFDDAELKIYGGGKLATFKPSPVVYKSSAGAIGIPMLLFYKDQSGNWHLKD